MVGYPVAIHQQIYKNNSLQLKIICCYFSLRKRASVDKLKKEN